MGPERQRLRSVCRRVSHTHNDRVQASHRLRRKPSFHLSDAASFADPSLCLARSRHDARPHKRRQGGAVPMIAPRSIANASSTRPSMNRALVVLLIVCWLVVAAQLPYSLHGAGILALLALVGLDALLGIMTGWLAFQPTSRLDERQRALRDRAYRMAFRLVGAGVVLMLGLYIVGVILDSILNAGPSPSTSDGFSARTILALVELLIITPTGVVAWVLRSDSEPADW